MTARVAIYYAPTTDDPLWTAGCDWLGQDPAKVSLTGIGLGQAAVVILAVLAVSGEYSTGMARLTFTAIPRRTSVLAAPRTPEIMAALNAYYHG